MTTSALSKTWPDVAIPPGETLSEELQARELSEADFAAAAGISLRRFRDLLAGRRPITADLALRLEAQLGVDAQFWMNLQTDYDLTRARNAAQDISH